MVRAAPRLRRPTTNDTRLSPYGGRHDEVRAQTVPLRLGHSAPEPVAITRLTAPAAKPLIAASHAASCGRSFCACCCRSPMRGTPRGRDRRPRLPYACLRIPRQQHCASNNRQHAKSDAWIDLLSKHKPREQCGEDSFGVQQKRCACAAIWRGPSSTEPAQRFLPPRSHRRGTTDPPGPSALAQPVRSAPLSLVRCLSQRRQPRRSHGSTTLSNCFASGMPSPTRGGERGQNAGTKQTYARACACHCSAFCTDDGERSPHDRYGQGCPTLA